MWIWRLTDDRWLHARQRLDFYHAVQHLAAVGRALCGEDKDQFKAWLKPLVRQLKNESAVKVIGQLETALAALPGGAAATAVAKEVEYFHEHQERMDYRAGGRAGRLAVARRRRRAGSINAVSSAPASSGVGRAMNRCSVWKPSGATVAGRSSFRIPHSTLQETEMRPSRVAGDLKS